MTSGGRGAWGAPAIAVLLLVLAFAAPARAAIAPSTDRVTAYPQPAAPPTGGAGPLAVAPDGSVLFTYTYEETYEPGEEPHLFPEIVRMNPQGQVFVVAQGFRAEGFATAADGTVWFATWDEIGRIPPEGQVSSLYLPDTEGEKSYASGPIVVGPDGNAWFTGSRYRRPAEGSSGESVATIDRVTPSGELAEFQLPGLGGYPTKLTAGPDGNVWFAAMGGNAVGWITPAGKIEEVPLPPFSRPDHIVTGPDGNLWFTEQPEKSPPLIVRMTPGGEMTQFAVPTGLGDPGSLVAGPDGRVWFAAASGTIGRIDPDGRLSLVGLPNPTWAIDVVTGPEGNVWYSAHGEPPCLPRDSGCGGGGSYEHGIVGRIEPAPLEPSISGAVLAAHAHRAKVRIGCLDGTAGSACRGQVRLRAGGRVVAHGRYTLGTDLYHGFALRLSREARLWLHRRGHLRVLCQVTLAGGRTAKRAVLLRPRAASGRAAH